MWKPRVCVQAAATYWNEQDLRDAVLAHPALSTPGLAFGLKTFDPVKRFLCLDFPPAGASTGGQTIDLVWMSVLRVLTDAGVPVGRRMTCRIRNVQEDPLRLPLDPLTAVRPDTVWSVSVYGDIRDRRDDSVPDEELCERLRTYFPASLRGNRRVAVEMEIAELTPGGAFDFCLSNLRQVCSELSIAMDFGAVAGIVDSEPGGRGAD